MMLDLNAIGDFLAVVRAGSFASAARATGIPKSTLSKRIQMLEASLDTRLLERSTRALRLTMAGQVFQERAQRIMAEVDDARNLLAAQQDAPQGLLRVSAPVLFGQVFLGQIAADYVTRYPKARIDIVLADRRVDMLEENIEAAIRIGELPDSSLVLRSFASVDHVLVASPGRPGPVRPEDLAAHPCIAHAVDSQTRGTWRLMQGLRSVTVEVAPVISVSSMVAVREAALAGGGIAYLPRFLVAEDLSAGRLVPVMPDWAGPKVPVSVVYPSSRFLNPRLRAFIDLLVQRFPNRQIA
jgi:LysR family transcriptional regulator, regulator for bpeEF and oprC